MSGYNKHLNAGMGIIVVLQKYCCNYRKTDKFDDRNEEHACNGRGKTVKSK